MTNLKEIQPASLSQRLLISAEISGKTYVLTGRQETQCRKLDTGLSKGVSPAQYVVPSTFNLSSDRTSIIIELSCQTQMNPQSYKPL